MNDQVTTEAQHTEPNEKRRCEHVAPSGRRCGRWASKGEELCHAHLAYAEARASRRVHVPLLEDEASILNVLSQAADALATGAMPPANGHAVISACKLATRILELRLKQKQWEEKHPAAAKAGEADGGGVSPASPATGEVGHPDPAEPAVDHAVCADDETLMAVSDQEWEQPFVRAGNRPCDRVQARADAAEGARYAEDGPVLRLPRFRKEDLQEQWENGTVRPYRRNENNIFPSKTETQEIFKWQKEHKDLMRAREQRMLDEYFGRVKKDGTVVAQVEQR